MNAPLTVSVPHRLGKDEAVRRLKGGLARMAANLGALITIEQEVWTDDRLKFQMRGLGQSAAGTIEVFDDSIRIDVVLQQGRRPMPTTVAFLEILLGPKAAASMARTAAGLAPR